MLEICCGHNKCLISEILKEATWKSRKLMDAREVRRERGNWIKPAEVRVQWWAFGNDVTELSGLLKAKNFLAC
jgi:hypothetical protein